MFAKNIGRGARLGFIAAILALGVAGWTFRHSIHSEVQRLTLPRVDPPAKGTIRIAVIGDYGSGDYVAREVAQLVESWKPDLVATLGDNNYEVGAAETIDRNVGRFYHRYISPYRGDFGEGATVNRFFPSIGHRDWDSRDGLKPYLDYFSLPGNERYYQFAWGPVHLFMLSTDEREPDGTAATSIQGRWLERELAQSQSAWRLVFAHHAPYVSGRVASFERMRWPFKQWGADAVLSGFFHVYERLSVDGLPYFVNGLGGAYISGFGNTDPNSKFRYDQDNGAMLIDANDVSITFRLVSRGGHVVDEYALAKRRTK